MFCSRKRMLKLEKRGENEASQKERGNFSPLPLPSFTKAWTFIVPLNLCHSVVIDWQEQEKGNTDTRHCSLCTTHFHTWWTVTVTYCLQILCQNDVNTVYFVTSNLSAAHVVHRQSSGWLLISHPWKGGVYFRKKDKTLFKIVTFQH